MGAAKRGGAAGRGSLAGGGQPAGKHGPVDVAAGEDVLGALAGQRPAFALQGARGRRAADAAGGERQRRHRGAVRDAADHARAQAGGVARGDHAANARAQADGHVNDIPRGCVTENLQRVSRHAGNQRAVHRRLRKESPVGGEPLRVFEGGLKIVAVLDSRGTEVAPRGVFSGQLPCGTTRTARRPWRRATKRVMSANKGLLDVLVAVSVTNGRVVVQGKQQLFGFDPKTKTSDGSRFYAAPSDVLANIAMFAVTAAAAV